MIMFNGHQIVISEHANIFVEQPRWASSLRDERMAQDPCFVQRSTPEDKFHSPPRGTC